MKPEGPVARRRDYGVAPVPHVVARAFVRRFHYAQGSSNTSVYAHGLIKGHDLVGVALWMPPAAGAAKWVQRYVGYTHGKDVPHNRVLALSRLVVAPGEPKNAAGMLLAGSTRLVQRDRRYLALVTYADTWRGHEGTVYKATGWEPAGDTEPQPVWVDANGRLVSTFSTKTRPAAAMRAMGAEMIGRYVKHRFVKVLA